MCWYISCYISRRRPRISVTTETTQPSVSTQSSWLTRSPWKRNPGTDGWLWWLRVPALSRTLSTSEWKKRGADREILLDYYRSYNVMKCNCYKKLRIAWWLKAWKKSSRNYTNQLCGCPAVSDKIISFRCYLVGALVNCSEKAICHQANADSGTYHAPLPALHDRGTYSATRFNRRGYRVILESHL